MENTSSGNWMGTRMTLSYEAREVERGEGGMAPCEFVQVRGRAVKVSDDAAGRRDERKDKLCRERRRK
jgi:hypothetical protein